MVSRGKLLGYRLSIDYECPLCWWKGVYGISRGDEDLEGLLEILHGGEIRVVCEECGGVFLIGVYEVGD